MKLLGGISSAQNGTRPAPSAENDVATQQSGAPADGVTTDQTPPPAEKYNVMADVIERHEQIVNRAKKTR